MEHIEARIAHVNQDVPLPPASLKVAGLAKFFNRVQGDASGLYSAIRTAWADTCHSNHGTRFLLDSRPEAISRRKQPHIVFKVVFESGSKPGENEFCKEAEVEILDEDDVEEQTVDQYVSRSAFFYSILIIVTRALNVRFQLEDKPTYIVIDGICSSLLQTARTMQPVSFYLSPDRLLRCQSTGAARSSTVLTPRDPHGHLSYSDSVTLNEVLANAIKIELRDKITIAFALVSNQLQLHSTPWLPTYWSRDLIHFPRIKDPKTSKTSVIYSCPFLQSHFSAIPASDEQILQSAKKPLLELGIILLEVWHQQTFTAYVSSVGKNLDEGYGLRYEAAKQWLDESKQQLLPSYLSVLSRCIECNIANRSIQYEWHDEVLRQSICEDLLRPLHDLCYPKLRS